MNVVKKRKGCAVECFGSTASLGEQRLACSTGRGMAVRLPCCVLYRKVSRRRMRTCKNVHLRFVPQAAPVFDAPASAGLYAVCFGPESLHQRKSSTNLTRVFAPLFKKSLASAALNPFKDVCGSATGADGTAEFTSTFLPSSLTLVVSLAGVVLAGFCATSFVLSFAF